MKRIKIDKSKWDEPEANLDDFTKQIEDFYQEYIDVTGNKDFKLFVDKSFELGLTALKGNITIYTYLTNLGYKLILKETNEAVYESFLTDHSEVGYIIFKAVEVGNVKCIAADKGIDYEC